MPKKLGTLVWHQVHNLFRPVEDKYSDTGDIAYLF